jgi:hypothetical protein
MRTKTLVLSGVIAALASASLMAQVYSLNSVGYVNVTIPTGFSIISDPLYANGQGVAQTVSPLLDSQVLNGNLSGLTFYKFSAGNYFSFGVNAADNAWAAQGTNANPAAGVTLNPGEAIYVLNPQAPTTFTFVGTVPQGTLPITMEPGYNMVSSVVPETGAIDTVLGLTPGAGDTLYFFDPVVGQYGNVGWNGNQWFTGAANNLTPPLGSTNAPTAPIGGGFFYLVAATSPEVWTRTFTIQ